MTPFFAVPAVDQDLSAAIPVYVCRPSDWPELEKTLRPESARFAAARSFTGETGQIVKLPDSEGNIDLVLFGAGPAEKDMAGPINAGTLSGALPAGTYRFAQMPDDWTADLAAIGWGLGAYKFEKYLKEKKTFPVLQLGSDVAADEIRAQVSAIHFGRDLINTPAGDMGPEALEAEARIMASRHNAKVKTIKGEALLAENYPMIHAVGRAAHEVPRLVEIEWGNPNHPHLALVGKGITFDTGGLNIKSAAGARIMKKDMGGAAHAIAMADMIMANNLPVRLHVLLAIAENAISAGAYRPGDILPSRAGLTVEIDNTDAEGRLVLGDALAKAAEGDPDLIIDFATLTGAARVALGPTLPPFFSNRDEPVASVTAMAKTQYDPLWPMPLWEPYMSLLSSPVADMKNSGGSFAGAMTAALFLERFVDNKPWMHFDVYGWNPTALPGHPAGGEMFVLRTLYHWLKDGGVKSKPS
ncbi:MAG: leucyl aminopeptidase family protein [Alphaproteobacteria bacterium]